MRSIKQMVDELRTSPELWADAAIVVAFEDRFELVGEDHPDPAGRVSSLLDQGGLPIGFAGVMPTAPATGDVLHTRVFHEYAGQAWAHRYMTMLRGIVRSHSSS